MNIQRGASEINETRKRTKPRSGWTSDVLWAYIWGTYLLGLSSYHFLCTLPTPDVLTHSRVSDHTCCYNPRFFSCLCLSYGHSCSPFSAWLFPSPKVLLICQDMTPQHLPNTKDEFQRATLFSKLKPSCLLLGV